MKLAAVTLCLAAVVAGSVEAGTIHRPPRHLQEATMDKCAIVELGSQPVALGGNAAKVKDDHTRLFNALKKAGIEYTVRAEYSQLLNGVSLCLDKASDISHVADVDIVDNVYLNHRIRKPVTKAIPPKMPGLTPRLRFAHNSTGVNVVHETLGLTGKGVKVGVIDTGIDYAHPDLGKCFGKGCRVYTGWDFAGPDFDAAGTTPNETVPKPGPDPKDCSGHGTHVAGIVGAKGEVTGVAPDVSLAAYKVFGCKDRASTSNDLMIAAMEKAYADGMDLINMSIGGGSAWKKDPLALVVDRLAKLGMLTVAAQGNDGANGLFYGGSPGIAENGLGVASFDNTFFLGSIFKTADGTEYAFSTKESATWQFEGKNAELGVSNFDTSVMDDGCTAYEAGKFAGKVAIIKRGTCLFVEKAVNAQNAGAVALIVYNREPGALSLSIDDPTVTIPVVGISQEDGVALIAKAANGAVKIEWTKDLKVFPNPTANQISDFSSWGLSPDLSIKPDIGGPGGLIYSTYPLALGTYATLSGTSMASPYVAGVAALYIGKHGKTKPGELMGLLQNHAVPGKVPSLDLPFPVARQGAGRVNALHIINRKTQATPSKLTLGDAPEWFQTEFRTITVKNTGNKFMKYRISHLPAASVNGTNEAVPSMSAHSSRVTVFPSEVVLAPGWSWPVQVVITPNFSQPENEQWLYSGYIAITPDNSTNSCPKGDEVTKYTPVYVPYAGFKGNYKSYKVFPAKDNDGLDVQTGTTYTSGEGEIYNDASETLTVSFRETDFPVFRVRILHPTSLLAAEVFNAKTGKSAGFLSYDEYIGRTDPNNGPDTFYYIPTFWDTPEVIVDPKKDKTEKKRLTDGSYYVVFSAVKALGSSKRKSDVEKWRSPTIIINTVAPTNATTTVPPATTVPATTVPVTTAPQTTTILVTSVVPTTKKP